MFNFFNHRERGGNTEYMEFFLEEAMRSWKSGLIDGLLGNWDNWLMGALLFLLLSIASRNIGANLSGFLNLTAFNTKNNINAEAQ